MKLPPATHQILPGRVFGERCAETLADLFGVDVSTGTLDNSMSGATDALAGFVDVVTGQLQSVPVVRADETSVRSQKAALWVHVFSTVRLTMLGVGRRDMDPTTPPAGKPPKRCRW